MRENGFYHRLFDVLDERTLYKEELREFFGILFGHDKMMHVPDPDVDWPMFLARVEEMNAAESQQWNPRTRRMEPWISVRNLKRLYGPKTTSGWNWVLKAFLAMIALLIYHQLREYLSYLIILGAIALYFRYNQPANDKKQR